MESPTVTIFSDLWNTKQPYYITVDKALDRIKKGASAKLVTEIRNHIDKDRQDELKKKLPCVLFSGKFPERGDVKIAEHNGFIVLDFDDLSDVVREKEVLSKIDIIYACWISPRNNGLKALVRVVNGEKHREHFEALRELFPTADRSGANESRVCFESYDPDIYINQKSEIFKKVKVVERFESKINLEDDQRTFANIVKWLSNRGDAFQTGERNVFVFKLASACCRFGMSEDVCTILISSNFEVGANKFSIKECTRTIESAYKANRQLSGTASFEKDVLVETVSRYEVEISQEMLDENIPVKDVVFGEDVKTEAFDIFDNGYQRVEGIGVIQLDTLFKFKKGETTLLSGIGNYGKSSYLCWKLLMRAIIFGERFAFFSPEENPSEFYHNLTETLLGKECTPYNTMKPSRELFGLAYDFISTHFFYVYPKSIDPTPIYIKERFLELIIKEKVNGVVIDPFNQLSNDYKSAGGRTDKYLETFLSDCSRFSQQNNIYFIIIAHPRAMKKDGSGNYPCPDVFDLADGAMWNNKMDNILIYDRPNHQQDPQSSECMIYSKKIRRQKIVGVKGSVTFNLNRPLRRFLFNGVDPMQQAIQKSIFIPQELKENETASPFNPNEYKSNLPISRDWTEPNNQSDETYQF